MSCHHALKRLRLASRERLISSLQLHMVGQACLYHLYTTMHRITRVVVVCCALLDSVKTIPYVLSVTPISITYNNNP